MLANIHKTSEGLIRFLFYSRVTTGSGHSLSKWSPNSNIRIFTMGTYVSSILLAGVAMGLWHIRLYRADTANDNLQGGHNNRNSELLRSDCEVYCIGDPATAVEGPLFSCKRICDDYLSNKHKSQITSHQLLQFAHATIIDLSTTEGN